MCDVPALRSDDPAVPYAELIAGIDGIVWEADAKTFQPMNVNFGLFPDLAPGTHPRTGKKVSFTAPIPTDMEDALKFLRAA